MKIFLIVIILFINSFALTKYEQTLFNDYSREFDKLSIVQLNTLTRVFSYGKKENFEWSLSGISWEESQFGVNGFPINKGELSFGLCHINLNTYFNRYSINRSRANIVKFGTMLILNEEKNLNAAIQELKFWEKSYSKYIEIWSHYNGGGILERTSREYGTRIKIRILVLKSKFRNELDIINIIHKKFKEGDNK